MSDTEDNGAPIVVDIQSKQITPSNAVHVKAQDKSYLLARYHFGDKLGQGSFGTVWSITNKETGEEFACKTIKKQLGSTAAYEQVQREFEILKKLTHPHVIQLSEVLETPQKLYLVMEICKGGELAARLKEQNSSYSEQEIRIIIGRLLDVVAYLHTQGIVHRDIKPENILLSRKNPEDPLDIKVSDFGLATFTNAAAMMENIVGTPLYMAPEIVQNLGYSYQCDIWSVGIMLYLFLCGYKKEVETEVKEMLTAGEIKYPDHLWKNINPSARKLVEMMLKNDPAKRITAKEAMRHPWILGISDTGNTMLGANVLDLMKAYNAELRLRKVTLAVLAMVRLRNTIKGKKTTDAKPKKKAETAAAAEPKKVPVPEPAIKNSPSAELMGKSQTKTAAKPAPAAPATVKKEVPKSSPPADNAAKAKTSTKDAAPKKPVVKDAPAKVGKSKP